MRARQNKEALKNNKNLKENNTEQNPNLNLKYKSGDELINNSIFENKVIEEINRLRTRPSEYAALLEELSHKIEKNKVKINNTNMKLTEGPQLFEEAINYLLDLDPLEPLIVSEGLSESAHELLSVFVIEEDVRMDDLSSKIHSLKNRLDHFGVYFGDFAELIDYGSFDPVYVVVNFLLCDGEKTRKDKKTMLNPLLKYVGISSGLLPSTKKCTVLNLVQYYFEAGEEIPGHLYYKYKDDQINTVQLNKLNSWVRDDFYDKKKNYLMKYNDTSFSLLKDENYQNFDNKIILGKIKKIKKITRKLKGNEGENDKIFVKRIITYENGDKTIEQYVI